jgi:hypothetical protein
VPLQPELEDSHGCRPLHLAQAWKALISWVTTLAQTRKSHFFSRCFLRLVANEMLKGDLPCALDDG